MGTNFYWKRRRADDPLGGHIGKRSAAGWYCYDCDETLQAGGINELHWGRRPMLDACPRCGKTRAEGARNAAMTELGFEKPVEERPRGVQGASSFTWATEPDEATHRLGRAMDKVIVRDEYHHEYTGREFLRMLEANCPVRFTHHVGQEFS